mmetsp:Transcript_6125/g.15284  ORF Transcript_6125/g.15284 Transcript_6125/m.15284 type:complete len:185 (-) Transcript_6125:149-703(-)|eukprot:CAMPEP_0181086434 /NCGR_PEP_ID=MMETSP1071-20121207/5747_1 /TAXON_ID=35127 /ORGANISM="Thalassiosira sp., Strain NH16" /LENGTH=184 /DNA_ID=CAMNT_0023168275 /DNA_START=37 /DNA_END=594 /DNA_ORIENTATION=+
MNTFPKSIFLMLATSAQNLAAHSLKGANQLHQAAASSAQQGDCIPDDSIRIQSKTAHKSRMKFNLFESDAECADSNDYLYERGSFDNVKDAGECADMCVNTADSDLSIDLRGFEYDCDTMVCGCLYDEGTIDNDTSRSFDRSNHMNRNVKGRGSITKSIRKYDSFCYKLVGMELSEEGIDYFFF